jgi:hypothetical protein
MAFARTEMPGRNARSDFLSVMSSGVAHNEAARPLIWGLGRSTRFRNRPVFGRLPSG